MEIINAPPAQNELVTSDNFAGFLLRFIAYIIDRFIIGAVTFILIVPALALLGISIYGMGQIKDLENMKQYEELNLPLIMGMVGSFASLFITSVFINWLYYSFMESSEKQATLGKLAVGIKVTDLHGKRISFLKATGRYFGKMLSGAIFMIGYIMIIFTQKKQGLHDVMAETLVVRK